MNKYYQIHNIYIYKMNNSNINGEDDWGLFIDIDSNNASIHPEATIERLEKYKLPNKKNPSSFEYCFHYLYYYWGIYIIHYVYK